MKAIHARERRGDRLELTATWAWDQLMLGAGHLAVAAWLLPPALAYVDLAPAALAALSPQVGTTLSGATGGFLVGLPALGVGLGLGYLGVARAMERVTRDRRAGTLRATPVSRGRRVVRRVPLHLVKRVEARPTALGDRYALVFEVRGEPPLVFPDATDAEGPGDEALAQRVRKYLATR